jgi:hypothetical protein
MLGMGWEWECPSPFYGVLFHTPFTLVPWFPLLAHLLLL